MRRGRKTSGTDTQPLAIQGGRSPLPQGPAKVGRLADVPAAPAL